MYIYICMCILLQASFGGRSVPLTVQNMIFRTKDGIIYLRYSRIILLWVYDA